MRNIDLPPVWLVLFVGIAWRFRWPEDWEGALWPGIILVVVAAGLTGAAVYEFQRAKTSIVPRRRPDELITRGIFRYSRNPIYLADVLALAGFSVMWGSAVGLILVPCLAWVLLVRFIREEERAISKDFGPDFDAYKMRTRRWF